MSQQINLYEARLRPRHELATARNVGVCALVLLVLTTVLALGTRFDANRKVEAAAAVQKQLADEQEKLTVLSKAVAERKVSPTLVAEQDSAKAMLVTRKEIFTVLDSGKLGNSTGFSALMSGFARQSQADLWLTGFSVTMGGEEIEIRGRTLDPSKLPGYVQRLSSEQVFQGRRFAALEMYDVEPEDRKPDQPALAVVAKPVDTAVQPPLVPKLPRYAEFVLRSENMVATNTLQGGGKP